MNGEHSASVEKGFLLAFETPSSEQVRSFAQEVGGFSQNRVKRLPAFKNRCQFFVSDEEGHMPCSANW